MRPRNLLVASLLLVVACASAQQGDRVAEKIRRIKRPVSVTPPIPTSFIIAKLRPKQIAPLGVTEIRRVENGSSWVIIQAKNPLEASKLTRNPAFSFAAQSIWSPSRRDSFTPNDPFFFPNQPVSGWPGQWYISNLVTGGIDANVTPLWAVDNTGSASVVAAIDDGIETAHPDLNPNYWAADSWDFGQNDADPNPIGAADNHGTSVSGILAARGGNGIGVCGIAPLAKLSCLRLNFSSSAFDTQSVSAILYHSSGSNHPIQVKNQSYGLINPFVDAPATVAALADSAAVGTIHVRSAGNSRGGAGEDVNKYVERNSVDTLVVGGIDSNGKFGSYSAFGASLSCVAPSANNLTFLKMMTTDRHGEGLGYNGSGDAFPDADYTSAFGFTSGAAPVVSGVMTLLKNVRPDATTRFVKHLLPLSCSRADTSDNSVASDGGWRANAAGTVFNQNYGWGCINGGALVDSAELYSGVSTLDSETTGLLSVNLPIPDDNATGVTTTFTLNQPGHLEELLVELNATHTYRGDLEAYLTSPSGTKSRLFIQAGGDGGANMHWTFSTNVFWGENPAGTWNLNIRDLGAVDTGTLDSIKVIARKGSLIPQATRIRGKVTLGDWIGTIAGQNVKIELRDTNGQVVDVKIVTLDSDGGYKFKTTYFGLVTATAIGQHWLHKSLPVFLDGGENPSNDFSLTNGDIDHDNTVSMSDYIEFNHNFEKDSSDPNWLIVNSNGVSPQDCDLDGDEAVTIFDYIVLSDHFDQSGD